MAMTIKDDILKMHSENLAMFFPDLRDHFMCPACLAKFPITQKHRISEAHIIPKAAGGTIKTLLCTDCNSHFGSHQDKWFGELLRIARSSQPSLFGTTIQEGHFFVDGQRVNGYWRLDTDKKQFTFCWDVNRNPPDVNKLMEEKLRTHPSTMQLKVPFPIMRKSQEIEIGFLTAGYLMFFAMFGYSWVLQAHLDPIRKQILHPEEKIIQAKYVADMNFASNDPWVGFMRLPNFHAPVFGFMKSVVLYPPMYHPGLYSELGELDQAINLSDICPVKFAGKPKYDKRLIVLIEDKVMIAPDWTNNGVENIDAIQFTYGSSSLRRLRPVGAEEYEMLQNNPSCRKMAIRLRAHNETNGLSRACGGEN